MNAVVLSSLSPVVFLIAIGFIAARAGILGAAGTKDLSNLALLILTPALLFRITSTVHVEQLDFMPVASYFIAVGIVFFGMLQRYEVAQGEVTAAVALSTLLALVTVSVAMLAVLR